MTKDLLIDTNPYRTIVISIESDKVVEVRLERSEEMSLVGNIYRGVVKNVLPGMSVAFVDIGEERNALLHFHDVIMPPKCKKIESYIRVGSEILVQVVKEPLDAKGAKLNMKVSLPGHCLVLLPTENGVFFSKRIIDNDFKLHIRELLGPALPHGVGVIVRSEAASVSDEELIREQKVLIERWSHILTSFSGSRNVTLLWQEDKLCVKAIRDLFRADTNRVIINDFESYNDIVSLCKSENIENIDRIQCVDDGENLIERFNISKQIDTALARRVWLKSGAYIVFDSTEALVSIDVNTGKNVGNSNFSATVFKTNAEAAVEIARQIRLRNLGGIIIIDFIDMDNREDREAIIKLLKQALATDPLHPKVFGMTQLGLVEIARRRTGNSLQAMFTEECSSCGGRGRTMTATTIALKIRQRIMDGIGYGNEHFTVTARPDVLSAARRIIETDRDEDRIGKSIAVSFKNDVFMNPEQFEVKAF